MPLSPSLKCVRLIEGFLGPWLNSLVWAGVYNPFRASLNVDNEGDSLMDAGMLFQSRIV